MSASSAPLRIGEVHALLRQEFPTIELSKIRYYEDKGLVRPNRSRKGYRLYGANDVECLREAFRLAQQEFVPLRVIRQRLIEQGLLSDDNLTAQAKRAASDAATNVVTMPVAAVATPSAPPSATLRDVSDPPASVVNFANSGARFSREEFLGATQLNETQLRELEYYGFLASREAAGRACYDECDVMIARRFRALGDRGVEVRHLQSLKRTVDRQVDLLNDLTAPLRQGGRQSPDQDVVTETRRVADDLAALRAALLTRSLQDYFGH